MKPVFGLLILAVVTVSGCSQNDAPVGKWEGFSESQTWMLAVRLDMRAGNKMKASALSVNVEGMGLPERRSEEDRIRKALIDQWPSAESGLVDYVGNTVTRKRGYAPLFIFEPRNRKVIFHFYAGGKLSEKVTLKPVEAFAR